MGESACLLRSSSHPSDAFRSVTEGDPIHALTESVSFGRFVSESLAWEKWSAFSHNRYLEEVEKFAKLGSVAQKKAYFEAHYWKKAALRKAAHAAESSAADVEIPAAQPVECDQRQEEDSSDAAAIDVSVVSADPLPEETKYENAYVTCTESSGKDPAVGNLSQDENSTPMRDLDECIEIRTSANETAAKSLQAKIAELQNSTSSVGLKPAMPASKSMNQSRPLKLPLPRAKGITLAEQRKGKVSVSSREMPVVEKKKSAPKYTHMSMSYASTRISTRKLRDITASVKLQQDTSSSRKFPTRASVNITRAASATSGLVERRTRTVLITSAAGRLVTDKSSSSLPKENSKLSSVNGNKGQSATVCSAFRFRSEERAAKQKEKQEEKVNAKDAENVKPRERFHFSNAKPLPPKLGKKTVPGTGVETKPRPQWQASAKGKSNTITRASVPSKLSRNYVRENPFPNNPR